MFKVLSSRAVQFDDKVKVTAKILQYEKLKLS